MASARTSPKKLSAKDVAKMPGFVPRRQCVFWAAGGCTRDRCTFLHAEVSSPASSTAKTMSSRSHTPSPSPSAHTLQSTHSSPESFASAKATAEWPDDLLDDALYDAFRGKLAIAPVSYAAATRGDEVAALRHELQTMENKLLQKEFEIEELKKQIYSMRDKLNNY